MNVAGTAIRSIHARQVYTNRGLPGVEALVTTESGAVGRAVCTSGVSVGTHEVPFAFDGGTRFGGKGVTCVAERINNVIAPAMAGMDASRQAEVDRAILSVVPDAKRELGGNATAAVSAPYQQGGGSASVSAHQARGHIPSGWRAMVGGHEPPRRRSHHPGANHHVRRGFWL